ncbi:hypothetical protein GOP47_0015657 [Adiantum capillus-veneris]|uniref:Large ribosomal subunit protein uL3m n=1 Tax=Adiantum capillus-veneris TaxID=13818 RepID=A0A9D4ZE63_ADICA|nr:hypothetical protein GOP47_0015657 [Adiantum capillus-veneris]
MQARTILARLARQHKQSPILSASRIVSSSWAYVRQRPFAEGPSDHTIFHYSSKAVKGRETEIVVKQPAISVEDVAKAKGVEISTRPREMTADSCRTGAIAIKCGMTAGWDKWGARVPYTVLWFDHNVVTQVKVEGKDCTTALQVGCGLKKAKQLTKPEVGHFIKQGVPLKRKLTEFPVTDDALLPVGTPIDIRHFVPGQYVDIAGITIGKGFQGGMKRWGFSGGPASHGASLSHRSLGSTGGRQDPGKVFKGKKMAGRMGGKRRTAKCVWIYKIDPARNLMWVRGQVPGHAGNFVFVKDAFQRRPDLSITPFPTYVPDSNEDITSVEPLVAEIGDVDPFLADD